MCRSLLLRQDGILETAEAMNKIRKDRFRTVQGVKKWDRFQSVLENAKSAFKVLKVAPNNNSKDPVKLVTPSA